MANCNPNTDIMKLNPNWSWWAKHISLVAGTAGVDKTDLTVNTTEFSFNSGGYYYIKARGRVQNALGLEVSKQEAEVYVRVFDALRVTNQAQFETGSISAAAGGTGATGTNQEALQIYPEPDHGNYKNLANYDGQIMLATNTVADPGGTKYLRASFQTDLDADIATGSPAEAADANDDASVIASADPSDLLPDGCYTRDAQPQSKLGYTQDQNLDNRDGTFQMWMKPEWVASIVQADGRTRQFFSFRNTGGGVTEADGGGFLCSYIFYHSYQGNVQWRLHGRPYRKVSSPQPSNQYGYYTSLPAQWGIGKWQLYTVIWDRSEDGTFQTSVMYLNGTQCATVSMSSNANQGECPGSYDNNNIASVGYDGYAVGKLADCTMDEVVFTDIVKDALSIAQDYADGLYYDNSDGYFTSADYDLGQVRLANIYWSEHLPADIAGADIVFDIYDGAAWQSMSLSNPAGESLDIESQGALRFRAYFQETDSGLVDTMVLDDVSITYFDEAEILYYKVL